MLCSRLPDAGLPWVQTCRAETAAAGLTSSASKTTAIRHVRLPTQCAGCPGQTVALLAVQAHSAQTCGITSLVEPPPSVIHHARIANVDTSARAMRCKVLGLLLTGTGGLEPCVGTPPDYSCCTSDQCVGGLGVYIDGFKQGTCCDGALLSQCPTCAPCKPWASGHTAGKGCDSHCCLSGITRQALGITKQCIKSGRAHARDSDSRLRGVS